MEKVKEPVYEEPTECPRCEMDYCPDCIDFEEVDFDIEETVDKNHPNPNVKPREVKWKGERVCPYCYNQLVDLKCKE